MLTEEQLNRKRYEKRLRRNRRLDKGEKHMNVSRYAMTVKEKKSIWKKAVAQTITIYYCRWAKSLGELEATHQEIWGTKEYTSNNRYEPSVFFGMFDLRDYIALWRHKGQKWILWAGSDLRNLDNGFIFNDGKLKWLSILTCKLFVKLVINWIRKVEHYVENQWEADILKKFNIESKIIPSFLGNVNDYPISYKWKERPQIYISAHPGREIEYGVRKIIFLATHILECDFHVYGTGGWGGERSPNLFIHGVVPKEQMNKEIKDMQCGLRLNETDGFSEITAKSILWGQYPITRLENPLIPYFKNDEELVTLLESLKEMKTYNEKGRAYYLKVLNKYPWNVKKH